MKRRDFLFEHIIQKDFVEDLMKSFGWVTLCGAMFAMGMSALRAGDYFQGFSVFALFLVISTMSYIYVAKYLLIPLDSAMYPDDPYWNEKATELQGINKFLEIAKVVLARNKIFYLLLGLGYFLYANEVAKYLASKIISG